MGSIQQMLIDEAKRMQCKHSFHVNMLNCTKCGHTMLWLFNNGLV